MQETWRNSASSAMMTVPFLKQCPPDLVVTFTEFTVFLFFFFVFVVTYGLICGRGGALKLAYETQKIILKVDNVGDSLLQHSHLVRVN